MGKLKGKGKEMIEEKGEYEVRFDSDDVRGFTPTRMSEETDIRPDTTVPTMRDMIDMCCGFGVISDRILGDLNLVVRKLEEGRSIEAGIIMGRTMERGRADVNRLRSKLADMTEEFD